MSRLASAFAKGRPALVFLTAGDNGIASVPDTPSDAWAAGV
jgi:hypothetical protein